MGAPQNLGPQFHQLTMFETAEDLREGKVGKFLPGELTLTDYHDPETGEATGYRDETPDEGWDRKRAEADAMGLSQHIYEHGGVERPVDLSVGDPLIGRETGTVLNGMHRVAAQHDINPKALIPVKWTSRMHAGSGDRAHYETHVPEDAATENWDRVEDEKRIGYKRGG